MKFLLVLLLTMPASAREFTFSKTVNPDALQAELAAAGFQVSSINSLDGRQWIVMPDSETKNPSAVIAAHVFVDRDAQIATARTQAIALAKKLKAGTATAAEKDALLLRLCFLLLSQDQ